MDILFRHFLNTFGDGDIMRESKVSFEELLINLFSQTWWDFNAICHPLIVFLYVL